MSRTLNLVDTLLARGRKFHQLGLEKEASHCWDKLANIRDLPADVAREAQTQLAELDVDRRRYTRARRHLAAALAGQPGNAHFHYLMATAIEADGRRDRREALPHYRRAVELDGEQAKYLCGLGLLLLELGDDEEEGVSSLLRAVELTPNDPQVIASVVEGIQEIDPEEARSIARAALFRNPRHPRFHKIWNDVQFRCLHEEQTRAQHAVPAQQGPTLLPFVIPEPSPEASDNRKVRRDPPSRPARPHFPVSYSGKKHA